MSNKINRTGETSINNKGYKMKIIKYDNACNIDVQFEDGSIAHHKKYANFINGSIENPSDVQMRMNRLGEVGFNKQGCKMIITKYISSQNIEVTFENGTVVKTSYSVFLRGDVSNQDKYFTEKEDALIKSLFRSDVNKLLELTGRTYESLKTRYYKLNPHVKKQPCYGLLRIEYPRLFDEIVDKTENFNITSGSSKRIEWTSECGHTWVGSPVQRKNGTKCPYCTHKKVLKGFNDLETLNPRLAKEWHPQKNKIKPTEVLPNCNKKVWWLCSKGHEWKTTIINRNRKHYGCPLCTKIEKESVGERLIKEFLEDNKISYQREYPINDGKSTLFLDFLTPYGAIEFDGKQHFQPVEWFGGEQGFINTQNRDKRKNEYCKTHNIPLLRIRYDEIDVINIKISNFIKGAKIYDK